MYENVDRRRTTDGRTDDGRRSHWYTIGSPMSLRLRRAKKKGLLAELEKKKIKKSQKGHKIFGVGPVLGV